MQSQNQISSFLKHYYPVILIAAVSFILFIPFRLFGDSLLSFVLVFALGSAVLVTGFVLYYKKRTEYSAGLRKIMKVVAILFVAMWVVALLAGAVLGVLFGAGILDPPVRSDTRTVDHDLLQTRVAEWVNTIRVENNVARVALDSGLSSLAEIRSLEISSAPAGEAESISDIDVNEVASQNGLECIIDGNTIPIHEYVLAIPHTKFSTIEQLVDFGMGFLIQQGNEQEKILAANMTRTGIGVSASNDHLFVVQTLC